MLFPAERESAPLDAEALRVALAWGELSWTSRRAIRAVSPELADAAERLHDQARRGVRIPRPRPISRLFGVG